jgi:hypothetical protein
VFWENLLLEGSLEVYGGDFLRLALQAVSEESELSGATQPTYEISPAKPFGFFSPQGPVYVAFHRKVPRCLA